MRTYVWTDVLSDYTTGMIVVIAGDHKEAARLLASDEMVAGHVDPQWQDVGDPVPPAMVDGLSVDRQRPTIYDHDSKPSIHRVYGGG